MSLTPALCVEPKINQRPSLCVCVRGEGGNKITCVMSECRTWQALISVAKRRSSEDAWKPVSALFSLESMLEGAPLILLTSAWLHRASLSRCWHMNCDPVVLKATFPASVLPHFDSTERFKSEYAAAMQTQPGCTYHPMSSDGWFTAHTKLRSGEFLKWKPLGKPMAFRLEGAASPVRFCALTPAG